MTQVWSSHNSLNVVESVLLVDVEMNTRLLAMSQADILRGSVQQSILDDSLTVRLERNKITHLNKK